MSPDKSLTVACGDVVVDAAMHNVVATGDVVAAIDVATIDDVVVVVRDVVAVFVWVQQC